MSAPAEVTIWELHGKDPIKRIELGVSIRTTPNQQALIDLAVTASRTLLLPTM